MLNNIFKLLAGISVTEVIGIKSVSKLKQIQKYVENWLKIYSLGTEGFSFQTTAEFEIILFYGVSISPQLREKFVLNSFFDFIF